MGHYTSVKPRRFSAPSNLGLERNLQGFQKHEEKIQQRRASIAVHDNNNTDFLMATTTDIISMDISPFMMIPHQETPNVLPYYYENDNDKINMPNIPIPNLDDNNLSSSPQDRTTTHCSLPRTKVSRRNNVNHEDNNAERMFESNIFSPSTYQVKIPPPASTPLHKNTFQPIIEEDYHTSTRNEKYLDQFIIERGENYIPPPPRGSYDTSLVQYLTFEVNDDGNNNDNETNNHHLLLTELDESDDNDMMVEINTTRNIKIRTSNSVLKRLFVMPSTD